MDVAAAPGDSPRLFNRELSWLAFNHRVLELAADDTIPLLERLRFCTIYAHNLDEFFMVRVAGLIDHVAQGTVPSDGTAPQTTLDEIGVQCRGMQAKLEDLLHVTLLPALAVEGVEIVPLDACSDDERAEATKVFDEQLYPALTPLAVGPGQPFPYISNLSLSVGVTVRDASTGETRFARVKIPEVLPRLIPIGEHNRFVRIDEVIAAGLSALFPGMEIVASSTFRVTRDADFEIQEGADDLLEAVERELSRRRFGDVVRLEIEEAMPADMRSMLIEALGVDLRQVFAIRPPLDVDGLAVLTKVARPDLRYTPWQPQIPARLITDNDSSIDLFAEMRKGDILVHHPYESFSASVERFIEQAVADPNVLAIKHTIYRTSGDAPIVPALAIAAEEGKQAVALVEVTARFDEERNIRWARALERAGVHVVHGRIGLKTHCKLALVVRREGGRTQRYVHIGTGNYHPATARAYTDFGLFTCDEEITADVAELFNQLTGFARPPRVSCAVGRAAPPSAARHRGDSSLYRRASGRRARADHAEDELSCRSDHHRRALCGFTGRRRSRPDCARYLLSSSRREWPVRFDPGGFDPRAFSRTFARLSLRHGDRVHDLLRECRHDATQPRFAHRSDYTGARRGDS